MSKSAGNGPDVHALPDQECGSRVPESMQRDQREFRSAFRTLGIIIPDEPVKCLIRSIQAHLHTVPLDKYMILPLPFGTNGQPVSCLFLFPASGHIHDNGGDSDHTVGAFGLCGFDDGLTIYPAGALCDGYGAFCKVQVIPCEGDQLPASAAGEHGEVKEQFELQPDAAVCLIFLNLADIAGCISPVALAIFIDKRLLTNRIRNAMSVIKPKPPTCIITKITA